MYKFLFVVFFLLGTFLVANDNYKEKKVYQIGKRVFEKKCTKNIDLSSYKNIDKLKSDIKDKNLCKPLKQKYFDTMALYLWDVKRVEKDAKRDIVISVTKHEKCPVCGMFTYKYPRWASQIFYKDGSSEFHYSFDGVKDMMKFYFSPLEWGSYIKAKRKNIDKMLVTDYYSQKAIDARDAFYVVGSDIYGPMGNEFIPFKTKNEAKTFYIDHRGSKILTFKEITPKEVYKLDE